MMITIGIYLHSDPARIQATLAAVTRHSGEARIILLADGPEPPVEALLRTLPDYPRIGWPEPRGAAAAFNQLAAVDHAPIIVFLESGAIVTAGWLDRLRTALAADPTAGLAGPSTNFGWNEQCLGGSPGFHASETEIEQYAQQLAARYGDSTAPLAPLYSLADFCYAVTRPVIDAIGAADEGYGVGPCWEMDYNIRAARAGFSGLWVQGAYVHRLAHTPRRERDEYLHFPVSKRRYQDSLCGLRLRGEKVTYEAHCRGDACPHFAPPQLIRVQRPLPSPTVPVSVEAPSLQQRTEPASVPDSPHGPLVSCIMPTCNRRPFIARSVQCFLRQDYPNRELIVVDDGSDPIADCLPDDSRIRYLRLAEKRTIGEKRNIACGEARGEIIVHWDDDDWYPGRRLRVQTQAITEHQVEVCGSSELYFFDAAGDRAWLYRYPEQRTAWVAGSTLAYRKSFWERTRFRAIDIGEDAHFVAAAGYRAIHDLRDPSFCVAAVHPGNTAPKVTTGSYWQPQSAAAIRTLLAAEPDTDGTSPPLADGVGSLPLISCIMPTYNRRAFLPIALQAFRSQAYPRKELIVVDDGTDAIGDLVEGEPNVRYLRLPRRLAIGAKRNLACREARGEIIAHWDDDDWYAETRLGYQAEPILRGEADVTGLENAFMLQVPVGEFWATTPDLHRRMFVGDVHGGTLVYRRTLLDSGLRYPETNLAEDAALLTAAQRRGQRLLKMANPGIYIYVRHGSNAWQFDAGRFLDPGGWQRIGPPVTFPLSVLTAYHSALVGQ